MICSTKDSSFSCARKKEYKQKIINLSEQGCMLSIKSLVNKTFTVIKLDGCNCEISNQDSERCDFYIKIDNSSTVLLELKGSDVVKASKQILSSIKLTNTSKPFKCFIIKNRGSVPHASTSLQKAKKQIKDLGSNLEIYTKKYEYIIE